MIIANPIYDSVFRVMMQDLVIAKGVLSALIGERVVELQMAQQEYVHRNAESGDLAGMRLDFHAVIEIDNNDLFSVIIELQKIKLGTNPLRFRRYLGDQYHSRCDVKDSENPASLPIISIYLLGYKLEAELPMVTHVARQYQNAVTSKAVAVELQRTEEFIELLTHDAYFIQIPKIKGKQGTALERVLSVFDQQRKLTDDDHRLEIDPNLGNSDPLITKMYRCLNEVQADPEIEAAMKLEDLFLEEQKDAVATERKRVKEVEAMLEAAKARELEEACKRKAAEAKELEEACKRKAAEAEVARLKKLLEEQQ